MRETQDQAHPGAMMTPTSSTSSDRYVLCLSNGGHPASLEVRKIYQGIADPLAAATDTPPPTRAERTRSRYASRKK